MKIALLIPIYQVKERSISFLSQFKKEDFDYFLIVNDGSESSYDDIYKRIEEETVFHVVSYKKNHGKGYALKYGFKHIISEMSDVDFVVTADGDGQHSYKDILKIRDLCSLNEGKLILGSRDIFNDNVPKKSRMGNKLSNGYITFVNWKHIKDTQTGLRAIPKKLFNLALSVYGNRYDYELNFLTEAVRSCPVVEEEIETIYENNNEGSHFRPVKDTLKLYQQFLSYILVGLFSFILDIGLFIVFSKFLFTGGEALDVLYSTLLARAGSGIFNFLCLYSFVFHWKDRFGKRFLKYSALFFANLTTSALLMILFRNAPIYLWFVKILIELSVSVLDYFVNILWVFARTRRK